MSSASAIAYNVKALRVSSGMSQTRLAALTGLSQTWISRLEAGDENPTLETLERLANAFGVAPVDLLKVDAA
ncbi:MAG: helix-turn-helix transcriptional regulator [Chromatiaceae bacterium]